MGALTFEGRTVEYQWASDVEFDGIRMEIFRVIMEIFRVMEVRSLLVSPMADQSPSTPSAKRLLHL